MIKLFLCFYLTLSSLVFAEISSNDVDEVQYEILIEKLINSKITVDQQIKDVNEALRVSGRLSGKILEQINIAASERIENRSKVFEMIEKYKYLVLQKPKYIISMSEDEVRGLSRSLALALTLYDVTNYTYINFLGHKKLRRILNEMDTAYKREENSFRKSIKGVYSIRNRKYLKRAIMLYNKYFLESPTLTQDEILQKRDQLIHSSYVYHKLKRSSFWRNIGEFFKITGSRIRISLKTQADFLNFIGNSIVYKGSKFFGNFMGKFQERRGKLFESSQFVYKVGHKLEPMDILLEKTPFRLTDNFIPGYWGHAAIYIGTQKDLDRLGIWDHELVQRYANEILAGKGIVEALRDKVQINTLEHFSDIDDFALLRLRVPLTDQEKAEHILRALSHVGKLYDFNFDVETGETIVCSELHYRTYVDIDFNTTPYIGRSTISVDQVAEQGVTGMPFEPIMVYIDGKQIEEDVQAVFDQTLIKAKSLDPILDDDVEVESSDELLGESELIDLVDFNDAA